MLLINIPFTRWTLLIAYLPWKRSNNINNIQQQKNTREIDKSINKWLIQWKCHQMYGWVVRSGELKQPKYIKKVPKNNNNNNSREHWYVVCEYFMEFVNIVLTCLHEKLRPKKSFCAVDMYLVMTVEIFPVRYVCENNKIKTRSILNLVILW